MGLDPMTHRLRHDLFSGMPQLIALANVTEPMSVLPLGEQAVRLQEAVLLAKYQYIKSLLQSATAMTGSSSSSLNSSITEENMVMNPSQLESETQFLLGAATCPPLNDPIRFDPAPDMQFPTYESNIKDSNFTMLNEEDCATKSPLATSQPCLPGESFVSDAGDACISSSFDGDVQPFWSDIFLEDSLFP